MILVSVNQFLHKDYQEFLQFLIQEVGYTISI